MEIKKKEKKKKMIIFLNQNIRLLSNMIQQLYTKYGIYTFALLLQFHVQNDMFNIL